MILSLDVGNSQILGGVYDADKNILSFRHSTSSGSSSDQLGVFLRTVLRENDIPPEQIEKIAICSVVPDMIHSLRGSCVKYFNLQPFILQSGVKTGLKIKYRNPIEVGADRIANSIAATHQFPNENLIIVDFGTATTFCAISKEKDYLGGVIHAGLRLCMEALEAKTAKLPSVEILRPDVVVGRSTVESIQSGLFFGHLHMVKGVCKSIIDTEFHGEKARVIGTGGFSRLFEEFEIFNDLIPDLVLRGLNLALKMNS